MESPSLVVVDTNPFRRNEVSKVFYTWSRHIEPYESVDELAKFWPNSEIMLIHDDETAIQCIFDLMLSRGWMPVIAYSDEPLPARIVDVVLMGAIDYFSWPASAENVATRLNLLLSRRNPFSEFRRRASHAQRLIDLLSRREQEVLSGLAIGNSNKGIANELGISPRTIEIHRGNMMHKLGVKHLGEAVSIAVSSGLASWTTEGEGFDPIALWP